MTGDADEVLLREKMRAAVAGMARRGAVLKRASGPYLIGLLCAASLVPVVAAGFTGLPVVLALSAAVGSVGANVLTDVTSQFIERLRKEGPDLPAPEVIERELAAVLSEALSEDGERAWALRAEIAGLLQRVGAVGAVVEVGDAQLLEAMVAGFESFAARFEEFGFVMADARRALWLVESSLRRQEAQQRAGLERAADQDVTLRLVLDKIAAVEARTGERDGSRSSAAAAWEGCPYRGLAPFEERHSAVFYGRAEATTRLVQQLSARLASGQILVVVGASGAGKSSLLRAGLVPRLASDLLVPGSAAWPRRVLTPTGAPLEELAAHLADLCGADAAAVHRSLAADPVGARLLARQAVHAAAAGVPSPEGQVPRRLVLIVDQFEELFTLTGDGPRGEEERLAFIAALSAMATDGRPGGQPAALVVIAVRGDFLDQVTAYPELREALRSGPFVLGPMTETELRLAITGPAAEAGAALEPGLASAILGELRDRTLVTGYDAGVLPLLSQAMLAVWEQRDGGPLTVRAYWRTGGIGQAVQTSAEGVYERLPAAARDVAQSVFTQLTVITSGGQLACRRASREELAAAAGATAGDLDTVLSAFATQRLLVLQHRTAAIAHDALLRGWSRLRGWLDAEQADRTLYREVADAAATWSAHGRDASFLYRGARLGSAMQAAARWSADPARFPTLAPATREFLAASQRAGRRARWRWRGLAAALSLLTVAALVATGIATGNEAGLRQQHALAMSRQLAAQSVATSRANHVTAGRLAAAAWRAAPTDEAFASMRALLTMPRSVLYGHTAEVTDVAFGPGGLLASASSDQTIRLWDPVTGLPVGRPLMAHTGGSPHVAFSRDGRLLATAGGDGIVQLWNPATRVPIGRPLAGHNGGVSDIAFSPDGRLLASACEDGTVRLWNPATGVQVARLPTGYTIAVTAVAFSPDGRLLAIATQDAAGDGVIQLWNPVTRRLVRPPLTGRAAWIHSVAFSPDSRLLAGANDDGTIQLWNPYAGREAGPVLNDNASAVYSVAFSPDGKLLASATGGGKHGTIRLWNPATGKLVGPPITGDADLIWSVAFSSDGHLLASGGEDGTVRLWDPATGKPVSQSMTGFRGSLDGVAFSPDGRLLATANGSSDGTVSLWDPATGRAVGRPLAGPTEGVLAVAFSPDGHLLASGDAGGTVILWDPVTGQVVRKLAGHVGPVNAVSFSRNGRLLAIGGDDGLIRLWNPATGSEVGPALRGHAGGVNSVAFSRDGRLLASGGADGTIRLWNTATGRPAGRLTGHARQVNAVSFSPDGRLLASGADDKTIRLWDLATRRQIGLLTTGAEVRKVVFSPDGRFLASGGSDGTVRLWDPATGMQAGRPVADPPGMTDLLGRGNTLGVTGLAFSPDGKLLAHVGLFTLSLTDRDILADTFGVICSLFGSLTKDEWNTYLRGEPYAVVCR